jgi:hypothetical protein
VIGAGAPPASLMAPTIGGGGQAGIPQVCEGDLWSDFAFQQPLANLYAFDGYRWSLNGTQIAPGQPYTPTSAQVGQTLTCTSTVTYPLTAVTATATSPGMTILSQPGRASDFLCRRCWSV